MAAALRKLAWGVPLLVGVLVALVGWWADRAVRREIEKSLQHELETVLEANVAALDIWIRNQERMAESIANDPQVRQTAFSVLAQASNENPEEAVPAMSPSQTELGHVLSARLQGTGYLAADLVTTNLVVAGSSRRGRMRLGAPVHDLHKARYDQLFATGKAVVITPFKPGALRPPQAGGRFRRAFAPRRDQGEREPGRGGFQAPFGMGETSAWPRPRGGPPPTSMRELSLMQVAAPLRTEDGSVVGALALIIQPELEFTRVLSVARSGDTGETFAFDQRGLMISQSRFDEQLKQLGLLSDSTNASSALTLELRDPGGDLTRGYRPDTAETNRPLTAMIADAVEGGSGVDVLPTRDYRGVPVVGAWRWLAEHGFGVATKMDVAEAYQPLQVLRRIFIFLLLLLGLCGVGLVVFSYSSLVLKRKFNEAQLKAKRLGQYTLQEKIGEGGMGVVYKASHMLLRRETAIKLLTPDRADPYSIRQFEREVRLTCQLTHPNTIQIYDYGHTPEGIFYYAMELLHGLTLAELLARHGPPPEARAIHLLLQVCDSLQEAHAAGLAHRDIKPSNIFLCQRGGVPDTVKVLDFGLVRRVDRSVNPLAAEERLQVSLEGTPLYLAPETIRDPNRADHRSDIYALGAVAYNLLTGQNVFAGETVAALCESHLAATPMPPSRRGSNPISPELETLILHCLEKDPDARPQSVSELRAALLTSPHALDWTLEKRAAWWAMRDKSVAGPARPVEPGPETEARATVRIDLAERFGAAESPPRA